jgi:hypothetical protein
MWLRNIAHQPRVDHIRCGHNYLRVPHNFFALIRKHISIDLSDGLFRIPGLRQNLAPAYQGSSMLSITDRPSGSTDLKKASSMSGMAQPRKSRTNTDSDASIQAARPTEHSRPCA